MFLGVLSNSTGTLCRCSGIWI